MKYLGIDIGGTTVKMGIVTEKGEISNTSMYDVTFDEYETPILTTVLKSVDLFLGDQGLKIRDIEGIGVSATGQIDTNLGMVIGVGGNIKNWLGSNIKQAFEDKYHIKTSVINDANSVAIGESWIGRSKNYSNVIVITIGTGVGGGVMVDSNILLGKNGIGGELGHFSINHGGLLCSCGNRGCYEMYASMTALKSMVYENKDMIGITKLSMDEIDGKVIFQLLEEGNYFIGAIIDQWVENIAAGLISLAHIFNPEIILIGGGVSVQEELFISKVRGKVLSGTMKQFGDNLQIEAASLGNTAGLVGAVCYRMKH